MSRKQTPPTEEQGPGPGRPRGALNHRTVEVKTIIDKVIDDNTLAQLLLRHALSDPATARYLADQKWGRPKYRIEHAGTEGGAPIGMQVVAPGFYRCHFADGTEAVAPPGSAPPPAQVPEGPARTKKAHRRR